jgi:hypothetical protein
MHGRLARAFATRVAAPDGQISASGAGLLADTNVFDTPIVGGTDGYFGVRGVVHGVQETQEVAQITVSLAE